VEAVEGFAGDEVFECFDAERELALGEGSLLAEAAAARQARPLPLRDVHRRAAPGDRLPRRGDPANGDGGVIAYRDPLGLEPPIPKVQRKRTLNTIGGPDVQKLMGTLAPGSTEVGLFITLGTFTSDAISLARSRHDLRLVNGRQLVDMIFDHYEQLDLEWRRLLPPQAHLRAGSRP